MLSVLLITASPDLRRSTRDLELAAEALRSRTDVRIGLWYLRHGDRSPAQHSWTVDDLRTWGPAATLDRIGARLPAGWLRGRRLRRHLRALDPDVVVLDDGLGARVLDSSTHPLILTRRNAVGPAPESLEPVTSSQDAVLDSDPWRQRLEGPRVLEFGTLRDDTGCTGAEAMLVGRRALGLPQDACVVAALAPESDPGLLIEILQDCAKAGRDTVHGLWLDPRGSPADCRAVRERASRGGVSATFHLRQVDLADSWPAADLVLLDRESADARVRRGLDPARVLPYGSGWSGLAMTTLASYERVLERLNSRKGCSGNVNQGNDANEWAERFMAFVDELSTGT